MDLQKCAPGQLYYDPPEPGELPGTLDNVSHKVPQHPMIFQPLELLTSRSKWAKLGLLLREQLLRFQYATGLAKDLVPDILSVNGDDLAARSEWHQWRYTAQIEVPAEVLAASAVTYRQDEHLSRGLVRAEYHHETAVLHQATLYSNGTSHVSVFDINGALAVEFSYAKYATGASAIRRIPVSRYLYGTTLTLYGNVENATGNIGHWIVDGLAQMFLALKHHELSNIEHVLVPELRYDFQRDSLLQLGIPESKIVELTTLECVWCERLIATSAPRGYSSCISPGWMIDGYRHALLTATIEFQPGKRLYISRRDAGSRKFVNEDEIIHCLEAFGFEAVEMSNYGFAEKIALFSDAEMIVGLTGAGLTNCLFCHPDAYVLELFPASYVTYFYASMCGYLEIDYDFLIFENHSLLSSMNKYYGNLFLDTGQLKTRIDSVIARRDSPSR